MTSRGGMARRAAAGCAAMVVAVAWAGVAVADVGIAGFDPRSAAPGDTVTVSLEGCADRASQVRLALARMSESAELVDADAVEVAATDGDSVGSYRIVVPALEPGLYGMVATCSSDGRDGFWGSEEYLLVVGTPDTATAAPAERPSVREARWRGLVVLASTVLALLASSRRRNRRVGHG